jgi:hypothetical protein
MPKRSPRRGDSATRVRHKFANDVERKSQTPVRYPDAPQNDIPAQAVPAILGRCRAKITGIESPVRLLGAEASGGNIHNYRLRYQTTQPQILPE